MADAIDTMILALQAAPEALKRSAATAAPGVEAAIRADVAAGRTPGGAAWKPTKSGKRALVNAASHVKSRAAGTTVLTEIQAEHYYRFQNDGTKSLPARPMLPSAGVPPTVAAALKRALDAELGATLKGGR